MPGQRLSTFSGIAPRLNPRVLPEDSAQDAVNALLESGTLEPIPTDELVGAIAGISGTTKTIFRLTSTKWAAWDEPVDVTRSPVAEDEWNRVYFTDGSYPKMSDLTTAATGAGPWPAGSYRLGIPRPMDTVSTNVTGTGSSGAQPAERAYTFTYVSQYGEEGPPAVVDLADIILVTEGQTVDLTFPSTPAGDYNLITKRVYRTDPNGTYRFVGEVALAAATLSDTVLDANLGEEIPSGDWDAPPDDAVVDHPDGPMEGLTLLSDGSMCGFSGSTLCFSEPNLPHAYPTQYQRVTDWDIVAVAEIEAGLLVTTEGKPYIAPGSSPAGRDLIPIDEVRGCVSARSLVDMGRYALYASNEGLVVASGSGTQVVTRQILAPDQWRDGYAPSTIHAYAWEGKYVAFFDDGAGTSGGFIFDPRDERNAFMPLDFTAQCGYQDPEEGALYVVVSGQLYRFARGAGVRSARWKSKIFRSPRPLCPGAAKVYAGAYPVTFKIWADGVLKHTQTVADGNIFRLPGGYKALEFEMEVSGVSGLVSEVLVAESPSELV